MEPNQDPNSDPKKDASADPKKSDPPIEPPIQTRSTQTFLTLSGEHGDEKTERALMGFFVIWSFEASLADFSSPKINLELVKKLHAKEISIEDFVRDSLQDEITSRLFLEEADSFAKYYFKWKYISDVKELCGDPVEPSWENYKKVKPQITRRHSHWKSDPIAAQTEKLQEADPSGRAGQLSKKGDHIFVIPPHPNTTFDEENFLTLLEGSISLTMEEKQRVIDAIPRLKIEQINELIAIFTEEREKFAELENEFAEDVAKLKSEREQEINQHENKKAESAEEKNAAEEAEELKKKLRGDE